MATMTSQERRLKRRRRVRAKVRGTAERPRLSVFRSNRSITAQLIDDESGRTLVAAYPADPALKSLGPVERAREVGAIVARRALEAGLETCVFDRGGYLYHGQVKALADGAREGGLRF